MEKELAIYQCLLADAQSFISITAQLHRIQEHTTHT
jgi:hypothetical protein